VPELLTPGLLLLAFIFWVITHTRRIPPGKPQSSRLATPEQGLANQMSGLVKCSGAAPQPKYRDTQELTVLAQTLAVSVAMGKVAVAAHMEAKKQGVCPGDCGIKAIIAGVVRDRKTLKKLEYDQPF
jgi:hypothetical protein